MRLLRGWFGEKKTTFSLWMTLNANKYHRNHNVIIPSKSGTTQIDHIVVSPYGVFIIETKNMKGWIFGSENQSKWTQVLYAKKYSFQNPIRQTFRQKKILAEYLGLDEPFIHTIIYFVGDCKFKTDLPSNVIRSGLGSHIKQYKNHLLSPEEIDRILNQLNKLASNSSLSNKEHIKSLHERHSSKTVCPRCGSNLVVRTVKVGTRAGSKFLGCEKYPQCRYTKNVD
jgi:restriction system protein